ncbi:MAG: hypothetical protein GYA46_09950 [candidate division Zixibacteria bacterium]|nr:hypothetical protein [candidate division Zixibacteria bacterium]
MKRWLTWGLSSLFVAAFALSMVVTMAQPAAATDSGVTCCFIKRCPGFQPSEMGSIGPAGCLHYGNSCDRWCGEGPGTEQPFLPPDI